MVLLRAVVFAAVYFRFVLPALPFDSLLLVLLLVSSWCTGLGYLLALVLPANQLAASSMAVLFAVGASLNGVFPSLRQLHPSPWFLVSGEGISFMHSIIVHSPHLSFSHAFLHSLFHSFYSLFVKFLEASQEQKT